MKNASQDIKDFVNFFLPKKENTLATWSNDFLDFLVENKSFKYISIYHIQEDIQKYYWIATRGFDMIENRRRGFQLDGVLLEVVQKKGGLCMQNVAEDNIPARSFDNHLSVLYIPVISSEQKIIFIFEIAISEDLDKNYILAYFNNLEKLLTYSLEVLLEKNLLDKKINTLNAANIALETSQEALHENAVKSIKIHEQLKDSIRYAQKIQEAILPSHSVLEKSFLEYFIIYQPKDIVSGDFYWFSQTDYTFLAVVDCTGHGVPGAFMSMIGNTLLNEIINVKREENPARVLEALDKGVQNALNQKDSNNIDGMDVCLCRFERTEKLDLKLTFCGAKRPIYYLRNNTMHKINGNRRSVGGWVNSTRVIFQNHEMLLEKNDIVYLSTDGFFDTPNPARQSFGTKRFKEIIEQSVNLILEEQKNILLTALQDYKQDTLQRDDVTMIAIKV